MEAIRDVATVLPVATMPAAVVTLDPAAEWELVGARPAVWRGLVRTARPKHWVKNLLVFAAPGAAGALGEGQILGRSVAAFAVFCVAASAAYFLNDAVDYEQDRRHPTKRHRPVASGVVPPRAAAAIGVGGLLLAVAAGAALGAQFALAVAAYGAVNLAYNAGLRREAVLDLAAVASGFVIRAIAGGLATGVALSEWFLVVVSAASLFVVAGKRAPATDDHSTPRVDYPPAFLRYVRLLASGVALTAYCLWAFDKTAIAQNVWFGVTIVPFALAMLRYALLVEKGEGGSPDEILLGDHTILVLAATWAALFSLGVYGA